MLVVWDALTATPVKVIPMAAGGGVAAMDMSADAMFIATLSYDYPQTLSVWEWPANSDAPAISAPVGHRDYQHCVRFNPVDVRDLVSNGAKEVIFWNWSEQSIAAFHPPRGISKLKKAVRTLSQSTFIPYTTKAVTATTSGHIVAWDYPVSELVQATGRDAVKILKLVKSGINLLDTVLDKFLVCGCADGAVRFFDFQFRVVAWFEDIQAGHITSISFADQSVAAAGGGGANGTAGGNNANGQQPPASSAAAGQVSMEEFVVPDFVVGTSSGKVVQLDSKTMEQLTADKRRGKTLVQGFDDQVHALDAHPSLPLFAVGTLRGSLQLWDIDERRLVAFRKFEAGEASSANAAAGGGLAPGSAPPPRVQGSGGKRTDVSATLASASLAAKGPPPKDELINSSASISCVKFGGALHHGQQQTTQSTAAGNASSGGGGTLLALGFSNGFVKIVAVAEGGGSGAVGGFGSLDTSSAGGGSGGTLKDVVSFHRSEQSITSLVFSRDGTWLASSDAQGCVALYRFWHKDDQISSASLLHQTNNSTAAAAAAAAAAASKMEWIYVGKYRAHWRTIVSLFFEEQHPPSKHGSAGQEDHSTDLAATTAVGSPSHRSSPLSPPPRPTAPLPPRLYSLGEDRVLQEYDLAASSIRAGLKISGTTRMEQTACPTAMMSLPGRLIHAPPAATATGGKGQTSAAASVPTRTPDLIITANDEFKLKVWEVAEPGAKGAATGAAGAFGRGGAVGGKGLTSAASASSAGGRGGGAGGLRKFGAAAAVDPTIGMSPSELEEYHRLHKCRKTLLAPLYGGALNKLFSLPKRDTSQRGSPIVPSEFIVYSTFDKLVGLIKLPLDGSPTKSMALIAHPGEVAQVVASFDGKYILTAGGADRAVNLWAVATPALEASIALGGKGIDPFLSLIDGGRSGALYEELLDYFTYAQLRSQGLATTAPRKITGYISVDEAVSLMRALGFYPTEQQVVAMKAEVRYENAALAESRARTAALAVPGTPAAAAAHAAAQASRSPDLLSLDEFLKLYVNHRPVFGLGARAFEAAFASLGARPQRGLALSAEQLVHQLLTTGEEPMSAAELEHCLDALLGERFVPVDAASVSDLEIRSDLTPAMKRILSKLPQQIEPHRFAQDILGFEDYENSSRQQQQQQNQQQAQMQQQQGGGRQGQSFADDADAGDDGSLEEEKEQSQYPQKHTAIVISQAQ